MTLGDLLAHAVLAPDDEVGRRDFACDNLLIREQRSHVVAQPHHLVHAIGALLEQAALYLVLEGSVEVRGDGPTRRADASDFFGEMALCDCEPHEAEAIAVTAAQVVPIDVMRFTSIVQNDPSFAIDVMHALAARILSRFEVAPVS